MTTGSGGATDAPGTAHARHAPPSRRGGIHTDVIVAGVIVAFCAAAYALTLTFDTVPAALAQGMGPEVFPRLVLGVMAVLAVILAWAARGKADEAREPVPGMVYLTGLAMFAFMGLAALAGMLVAMFVAVVGIGRLWGERRWGLLILTGLGLSVGIRLLFVNGFGIALPRGLLGDWLF